MFPSSMLKGKKILIIAPHPDDEVIGCGGIIMLAKQKQAKVLVLFMSVGYSRQLVTKQTNADKRIKETDKAAKYGNFTYKIAFQGKQFMRLDTVPQKELIEKIEDTSYDFKPDIVCIPFRYSFDQDHRAVSTASITAFRPLPQSLTHQPRIILEYEEPYSWTTDKQFLPNFYINISSVIKEKIMLLKQHKTQLRKDPFPRSPKNLQRIAGIRGAEIGIAYAESYSLLREQWV